MPSSTPSCSRRPPARGSRQPIWRPAAAREHRILRPLCHSPRCRRSPCCKPRASSSSTPPKTLGRTLDLRQTQETAIAEQQGRIGLVARLELEMAGDVHYRRAADATRRASASCVNASSSLIVPGRDAARVRSAPASLNDAVHLVDHAGQAPECVRRVLWSRPGRAPFHCRLGASFKRAWLAGVKTTLR